MKKKFVLMAAALLCTAGVSFFTAMSYMTDSDSLTNKMTVAGEKGMDAVLTEPGWNPENARLLVPNMDVPKDPQITNTSELDIDELVAIRIEFVYSAACPDKSKAGKTVSAQDMAYIADCFDIDYNADGAGDWTRFSGETKVSPVQRFYYNHVLKRNLGSGDGDTTIPLFTKLSIPAEVNNTRYKHVQDIGGFDIKVSGHAIQHMQNEQQIGLATAELAYERGLFVFPEEKPGTTEG